MGQTRKVLEDLTRGEIGTVDCARCLAHTRHKVIASRNITIEVDSPDYSKFDLDDYEIIQCEGCQQISFRHVHRDSEEWAPGEAAEGELIEFVSIYPPRTIRRSGLGEAIELPAPIRGLYQEMAFAFEAGLIHLVALALNPILEAVFEDLEVEGKVLYEQINAARQSGLLLESEAEALHKMRQIRNAADHEAEQPRKDSINAALEITERLLSRLYQAPMLNDRLLRQRE